eukprot:TRINITY_DN5948_c0_g1_i1.p1 TRINITY_DN5948_c0_g1~~TRINITY_DN5948_c0_g1_i1.p1  ORF type:complete len:208 (+),score=55.32 TRINITY_DN5948_c0_g1_i1:61-684(+)
MVFVIPLRIQCLDVLAKIILQSTGTETTTKTTTKTTTSTTSTSTTSTVSTTSTTSTPSSISETTITMVLSQLSENYVAKDKLLKYMLTNRLIKSPSIILDLITPYISTLNLAYCDFLNEDAVIKILKACQDDCLRTLNMSNCKNIHDWKKIIPYFSKEIRHINLCRSLSLTDVCIQQIVTRCPHVIALNVSDCKTLTDDEKYFAVEE